MNNCKFFFLFAIVVYLAAAYEAYEVTFFDKPEKLMTNTHHHHVRWLTKNTRFPITFRRAFNLVDNNGEELANEVQEFAWKRLNDIELIKEADNDQLLLKDGFRVEKHAVVDDDGSRKATATQLKIFKYDFSTHDKLDTYEPVRINQPIDKRQQQPADDRDLFTLVYLKSHAILLNKTENLVNVTCVADFLVPNGYDQELNEAILAKMEKNALFKLSINRMRPIGAVDNNNNKKQQEILNDYFKFNNRLTMKQRLQQEIKLQNQQQQQSSDESKYESSSDNNSSSSLPYKLQMNDNSSAADASPFVEDKAREEEEREKIIKENMINLINELNKKSYENKPYEREQLKDRIDHYQTMLSDMSSAFKQRQQQQQQQQPQNNSTSDNDVQALFSKIPNFEQQLKTQLDKIRRKIEMKELIKDYQERAQKQQQLKKAALLNNYGYPAMMSPYSMPFLPMPAAAIPPSLMGGPAVFMYKKKKRFTRSKRESDENDDENNENEAADATVPIDDQMPSLVGEIIEEDTHLSKDHRISQIRLTYGPLTLYRPIKNEEIAVCYLNLLNHDDLSVEYSSRIHTLITRDDVSSIDLIKARKQSSTSTTPATTTTTTTTMPTKDEEEEVDPKWLQELNKLTKTLEEKIKAEKMASMGQQQQQQQHHISRSRGDLRFREQLEGEEAGENENEKVNNKEQQQPQQQEIVVRRPLLFLNDKKDQRKAEQLLETGEQPIAVKKISNDDMNNQAAKLSASSASRVSFYSFNYLFTLILVLIAAAFTSK